MAISDADLAAKRGFNVELIETLRQTRGTSNESLEGAPEGALRRAIRRLSVPDAPRARLQLQLRKSRGDDGHVPSNAIGRALQQTRTLGKRAAAAPRVAGLPVRGALTPLALEGAAGPRPTAAGLSTKRWQWLGPGNVGGRTRAIVIHPTDTQRMLAASAAGGVWFTENGGARWDPVDDFMANLAVYCLADRPEGPKHGLCRHRRGLRQCRRAARWRHLPDRGRPYLAAHRGHEELSRRESHRGLGQRQGRARGDTQRLDAQHRCRTRRLDHGARQRRGRREVSPAPVHARSRRRANMGRPGTAPTAA